MGQYRHHMAHHVGAIAHSNEFLHPKILIVSGFMSYKNFVMISIKT
jgi:hypothetical protein